MAKVIVVGFDGSPDAIASIKAGGIEATVLQARGPHFQNGRGPGPQVPDDGLDGLPEKQSIDCELVTRPMRTNTDVRQEEVTLGGATWTERPWE